MKDCSDDASSGFISAIYAGYLTNCADITIPNDVTDGLIATSIEEVNSTYFDDNAADVLTAADNDENLTYFADVAVSNDVVDVLIVTAINAGN